MMIAHRLMIRYKMLHVISEQKPSLEVCIQEVIRHRCLEHLEDNNLSLKDESLRDGFDTEGTLYIAYHHKDYGVIGSARALPKAYMPSSMLSLFPITEKNSFYLVDCIFYPSQKSSLLEHPDHILEAKYENLYKIFYKSVTIYLENLFIQHDNSQILFYLNEEALDCLHQESSRDYHIIQKLNTPADEMNRYLGFVDMADLAGDY